MTHQDDCHWQKVQCEYKATHEYCPHPEHACSCPPKQRKTLVVQVEVNPATKARTISISEAYWPDIKTLMEKVADSMDSDVQWEYADAKN